MCRLAGGAAALATAQASTTPAALSANPCRTIVWARREGDALNAARQVAILVKRRVEKRRTLSASASVGSREPQVVTFADL